MKIEIKKPVPGYAYFDGDVVDVSKELADGWITSGYAVPYAKTETAVAAAKTETATTGKK